jgi:late competence protein required for DNA uptake (superfamily II DNA/RNA helicase)
VNFTRRQRIPCPFCGSENSELLSLFGQQLLTVQYYCRDCKTPFERVRGPDVLLDAADSIRGRDGAPGGP